MKLVKLAAIAVLSFPFQSFAIDSPSIDRITYACQPSVGNGESVPIVIDANDTVDMSGPFGEMILSEEPTVPAPQGFARVFKGEQSCMLVPGTSHFWVPFHYFGRPTMGNLQERYVTGPLRARLVPSISWSVIKFNLS